MSETATKPKKALSLSGLSEEQRRIINAEDPPLPGGTPPVVKAKPAAEVKVKESAEKKPEVSKAEPMAEVEKKSDAAPVAKPRKRKPAKAEVDPAFEPLSTQSFRLPNSLLERLLRASMERKIKRQRPFTQQDIVADALEDWLAKEGF